MLELPLPRRPEVSTTFTSSGKPKRSQESIRVQRQYANVIRLFLAGKMPNFTHQRQVHVANILRHIPYRRGLMHLGLQVMAHRAYIPHKYNADITDRYWYQLDGTPPNPEAFTDLPGGASGATNIDIAGYHGIDDHLPALWPLANGDHAHRSVPDSLHLHVMC